MLYLPFSEVTLSRIRASPKRQTSLRRRGSVTDRDGYNERMKKTIQPLWDSVLQTDRAAAIERVRQLRASQPKASRERLHRQLLGSKCVQVGVVGALTAITGAVPGLSRIARFALGPLVDATLVSALQAELVIETFALYEMPIPEHGEKIAVLAIAATNLGADEIADQASRWISQRAGRLFGIRIFDKAWPIAKIATAAATHVALTYSIGKRTQALCQIKDARIRDWPSLFQRVVSIDQGALTTWATRSLLLAFDQVGAVAGGLGNRLLQALPQDLPDSPGPAKVQARPKPTLKRRPRVAKTAASGQRPVEPAPHSKLRKPSASGKRRGVRVREALNNDSRSK